MMKKALAGIMFIALAGCGVSQGPDAPKTANAPEISLKDRVIVYYFHGNFRCATCKKMEKYSEEAVTQSFGPELLLGKVVFKPVNVDETANRHFVNDYGLYTKALVLSRVKDGKEVENKNLQKIWELVGNKDKYSGYVKGELDAFIKDLK